MLKLRAHCNNALRAEGEHPQGVLDPQLLPHLPQLALMRVLKRTLNLSVERLGGGDGVELPLANLLHELGVLFAEAILHLLLHFVRGPGEDELPYRREVALLHPASLLEELPMLPDLLFELLDALAVVSARHDYGRCRSVGVQLVPDLEYRAHLRDGVLGLRVVGLVHADDVRD